jgi:pimeloyl-ACP methyl ester carboxylesterase
MLHYRTYHNPEATDWVVFIHGAGGSSAVWYKQIQSYAHHFNLLLIDLRGHGRSADGHSMKRPDYTFEAIAMDVTEVLDHVNIQKAHFVGVSLGTIVIRKLALLRSSYVKSMVLVGAITHMTIRSRFLVRLGHLFHKVIPVMWLYKLFAFIIMPHPAAGESRNVFVREAHKLARHEFIRWFKLTHKLTAKLRFIESQDPGIPVLYVMGEQDYLFLGPIRDRVGKFANHTLEVVKQCGHVVNIEQPNTFNDLSIRFIRSIPDTNICA